MAIKETDLVREALDRIIPVAVIREAIRRLGVQQRQRILDPVALVSTMILVGGTAEAGRLAAVLRDDYATGRTVAARSAGYKWFDEELLALMRELVALALDERRIHRGGRDGGRTSSPSVGTRTGGRAPAHSMR